MDVSVWTGALSAAVSRGSAPLVVGACRRGNTRVTAVIGGLVLALASLFTSFALQTHQVLLRCVERGDRCPPFLFLSFFLLFYSYGAALRTARFFRVSARCGIGAFPRVGAQRFAQASCGAPFVIRKFALASNTSSK